MTRRYLWSHFDIQARSWHIRQIGSTDILFSSQYFDRIECWGKCAAQQADTVFFLIGFDWTYLGTYFNGQRCG